MTADERIAALRAALKEGTVALGSNALDDALDSGDRTEADDLLEAIQDRLADALRADDAAQAAPALMYGGVPYEFHDAEDEPVPGGAPCPGEGCPYLWDGIVCTKCGHVPPAPDPAARSVVGFTTLQFHVGGLVDGEPVGKHIHLVRATKAGTPGATLCGIDRFRRDTPGWSVGGGTTPTDQTACPTCATVARHMGVTAPGGSLPITGIHAGKFSTPAPDPAARKAAEGDRRIGELRVSTTWWLCPTCGDVYAEKAPFVQVRSVPSCTHAGGSFLWRRPRAEWTAMVEVDLRRRDLLGGGA